MTRQTATKIAQMYIDAGYTAGDVLLAMMDADSTHKQVAVVLDAMEEIRMGA